MSNRAAAREYPMTERDQQLGQSEADLAQEESTLVSEITRMMAAATEFDRKVKSVRAVLAEAAMGGCEDPSLAKRVNSMGVPPLETEAMFSKARDVRAKAVEARAQANQHVRETVSSWKQQLSALNAQILNDEKSAQRLVSQMKKEKARAAEAVPEVSRELAAPPALKRVQPKTEPVPAVDATLVTKRHSQRVQMQAAIDLHSDDNFFSGFSANISDGGLFVATVNYVPKGTHVDLAFSLPSGQKISATGIVRWIREVNDQDPTSFPGLGVQFVDLDEASHQAIHQLIEQRDPMFYID